MSQTIMLGEKQRMNQNAYVNDEPMLLGGTATTVRDGFLFHRAREDAIPFAFSQVFGNWASPHPTSANFSFADGSVRPIQYTIASGVFAALITPAFGESHEPYESANALDGPEFPIVMKLTTDQTGGYFDPVAGIQFVPDLERGNVHGKVAQWRLPGKIQPGSYKVIIWSPTDLSYESPLAIRYYERLRRIDRTNWKVDVVEGQIIVIDPRLGLQ